MIRFIFGLSVLLLLLSGCFSEDGYLQVIDEQGYNNIIHTEELENGVVVFYIPDHMSNNTDESYSTLAASFIKKTTFGWTETTDRGAHSVSDRPELTSQYLYKSDDKSPFPMFYGTINNPEINNIEITNIQTNNLIQAKIIDNDKKRIWYAFLNQPKKDAKFEIKGMAEDGKTLTSIVNSDLLPSNSSNGKSNE